MPPGSPSHQPPPPPSPAGPSEALGAPRASGSAQMPPSPPLPSSTNQENPSKGSATPSPSKTAASAEYQVWTTTDIRLRPSISLTPADLEMDEDMAPDEQAQSSDDEDIESAHIPTGNLRQGWWKPFEEEPPTTSEPAWSIRSSDVPVLTNNCALALASNYLPLPEDSLLAQTGDIAIFIDWFCKRRGITELKPQDLEGPAYEIVKVFHPDVIHLQYQMEECHKLLTDSVDDPILRHNVSKPLPLRGPPGQVTIQSDFFFNKDFEYLRYDSKGRRPALSISKMKTTYYPDAGLEQMVPYQFWIKEECKYDIAAMYVFSMYGYDYMKKIVLRRADLNEHVIAERDFKYLYPSDFEDLYLLNLQGHLNHLPPKDKKILTTAVNQWTRQLIIRQCVKDFQLGIESYLRAVIFRDKYKVQMMMRFNEIHKFNDGTLLQINEVLDYRVKEFRINRLNPVDIEKVAVCSSLRSPKSKCTIESRAKRSSKIISLRHDSTLLASSHTVKSKTDIKSPTHYPCVIKSSVENLVPIPSESEGEPECDMPAYEEFTSFLNILFDSDYDFYYSDDHSFSDEDPSKEIYSNPLFDEEIIPMKIYQHHFNVESDLIESMLNLDSSIIISLKIDSLFDEFAGKLILLKPIPLGIDETDFDHEEETYFKKRLLYDNSSPRPSEEFVFENSNAEFKSFSPSPIPIEDSDSLMEKIHLSFTSDYPMPSGIEDNDYDSKRDVLILD
nr:hypothetical protein [Tanacetum cinerariifolium]